MLRRLSCSMLVLLPIAVPSFAADQIEPGEWEATMNITSVVVPGLPPQVAKAFGEGRKTTQRYCVTPEQAANGPQEMLRENPSCQFNQYSVSNGRITAQMSCSQNGGTLNARIIGSYTPKSFQVTSSATVSGRMSMRLSAVNSGRRIGPCAG